MTDYDEVEGLDLLRPEADPPKEGCYVVVETNLDDGMREYSAYFRNKEEVLRYLHAEVANFSEIFTNDDFDAPPEVTLEAQPSLEVIKEYLEWVLNNACIHYRVYHLTFHYRNKEER